MKTTGTNTYTMAKLANESKRKSSLFLLSIIDFKNSPLVRNMLLMMPIKIFLLDNPYKTEKTMEAVELEKWRKIVCIHPEHLLYLPKNFTNIQILSILKHVRIAEC